MQLFLKNERKDPIQLLNRYICINGVGQLEYGVQAVVLEFKVR